MATTVGTHRRAISPAGSENERPNAHPDAYIDRVPPAPFPPPASAGDRSKRLRHASARMLGVIVTAALALLASLALAGSVSAAQFEPGFNSNALGANDDGSSASISVTTAFPMGLRFFGMTYNALFVNNNGNITFGGPVYSYTPTAFPVAAQRMIAPWWGDVDTRDLGQRPGELRKRHRRRSRSVRRELAGRRLLRDHRRRSELLPDGDRQPGGYRAG